MPFINPFQLKQASTVIANHGVIAYPTEAVFGLGCHPQSLSAIERILHIKKRPWQKGLLLVISDIEQAKPYLSEQGLAQADCFEQDFDYPVTWLLPASNLVSPLLKGDHAKIAIRLSKHPMVRALCESANSALVSTSANRAGQPEMRQAAEVRCKMLNEIDLIVAAKVGGFERPSAIMDAETQKVLRAY